MPGETQDLLQRTAAEEALWTAWDEVRLARGAPRLNGVSVKAFGRAAAVEIRRLVVEIPARRCRLARCEMGGSRLSVEEPPALKEAPEVL